MKYQKTTQQNDVPKCSLRNNITIAFVLGILLFGGMITAMSLRTLDQALADSGLSAQSAEDIGRQFTRTLTGFTIVGTAVALGVAFFLSRTITQPLQRLLAGIEEIGRGHLDRHIDVAGDDELGHLAMAFNDMAKRLKESHDHMESTVMQRTVELTETNERLQTEIAERWRAEEALRAGEHRLQCILDSIVAGVLVIDPQTHLILDVNESAAAQIGVPKSEIVGKLCHKFVCPAEEGKCPITDLGQTLDQSERVLIKADGSMRPIIKSVTEAVFHGKSCLIGSFVDITEQKKAEEKLKESLSLVEATLESTADSLLVIDRDGAVKQYNKQCVQTLGIPEHVFTSGEKEAVLRALASQAKNVDQLVASVRRRRTEADRDGVDTIEFEDGRIVEGHSKPHMVDGRIIGRVWSLRDVTERTKAKKKQDALLEQIAAINEELSHFAYVVSHDLKAPLRGIKLITEWLYEDYADQFGDEAKEQMDLLMNRVQRMHNLIEGVLQYSRVGRIKEEHTTVDLNRLVTDVADIVAPPDHIDVIVEDSLPVITCEKTRITQVFQNLISNAVKYMDKPEGRIVVGCAEDRDTWTFWVSDNGPGIEAKYFDRIFRIFQTLTARDKFESTGVGLTLVRKIVEFCGGKVWVESEVGRGSTFFFTFPKQTAQLQEKPEPVMVGSNTA